MSPLGSRPRLSPPEVLVAGRYRLGARLGSGGMGAVHEALDLHTGETVALKLLHRDLARDPTHAERFLREGRALAQLDHPAIVQVRGCGPTGDGGLYLAMARLHGETLAQHLHRRGALDPMALHPILRDLALGLHFAHERGIAHRDLKPANVVLSAGADRDAPIGATLIDFGVAADRAATRLTRTGEYVGTPRYVAPEQLAGTPGSALGAGGLAAEARADVYGLGVIAYEALTGESPFPRDAGMAALLGAVLRGDQVPLRARRPELPTSIEAVIARAMAHRPDERFASALELSAAWDDAIRPVDRRAPATIPMAISSAPPPRDSIIRTREHRNVGEHRSVGEHRAVVPATVVMAVPPSAPIPREARRPPQSPPVSVVPTPPAAPPPLGSAPPIVRGGAFSPAHVVIALTLGALALALGAGLAIVVWALLR